MKRACKMFDTNTDEQKVSPIRPLKINFVRTKRSFIILGLLFLTVVIPFSCKKEKSDNQNVDVVLGPPTSASLVYPHYFPIAEIPEDNPLTEEGIALGRRLYYDNFLSKDGPMNGLSCSSCHLQEYGFTVPDNFVLPHVNLAWSHHFLWEGKVSGTLEDVMLFEVEDFFETDASLLNKHPLYPRLFKQVFGKNVINEQQIAYALAQFVRTQISANSRFDKFYRREIILTEEEVRGFEIFNSETGDCFHCHAPTLVY
jgi:cytochrome c peroxidase